MTLPLNLSIYFSGSGLSFSAQGLPSGLSIDAATGIVSGAPGQAGLSAVTVTAMNGGGQATAAFSWLIEAAAAQEAPANIALPSIAGAASVGQVLTAAPGGWTGQPLPVFTYQWLRNGAPVAGATASAYLLGAADVSAAIAVRVTGTNPAGAASATSAAVDVTAVTAPVVIGFFGQSDLEWLVSNTSVFINEGAFPTISNPNCRVVTALEDLDTISEVEINDATIAARQVNMAMAVLAAFCGWKYPTRSFVFLDLAVAGSGRNELYDDSNPNRQFSDFMRVIDYAETNYKLPDLLLEYWWANDAGRVQSFLTSFAPFYLGQRAGGGAFTLGTTNPDDSYGVVDHCLWDAEAASDAKGRGVFTRDGTKIMIMEPLYIDAFTGASPDGVRAALNTFLSDSRVPALSTQLASPPYLTFNQGNSGHAETVDSDGHANWASFLIEAVARLMGETVEYPQVESIVEDEMDASRARITVTLPNGGDLTTFLALNSRTFSTDLPSRQAVTGVEIARFGDAEDDRQPVWNTAETGKPSAFRGTVTIEDAGSGSPRKGVILVEMEEDFAPGDAIYFNWHRRTKDNVNYPVDGDPNNHIVTGSILKPWMGFPVETVPALTDAAALYPFIGVQPPQYPSARTVGAYLEEPVPDTFWTQGSPPPGWIDSPGTAFPGAPTAHTIKRIRFSTVVRIPASALPLGTGSAYLAHQEGNNFGIQMGNSKLNVVVQRSEFKDSAGVLLLPAVNYPILTMPTDQWVEIVVDADMNAGAAGQVVAYVNGVPVAAPQDFVANSGFFAAATNRQFYIASRGGTIFWPPGCQMGFGQFEVDTGAGLVLYKRLEGGAAAVNADPWKVASSGLAI